MECPSCKAQTCGIVDANHLWCDQCGVAIRSQVEFLPSYQNCHNAPRQQIYNRRKRFMKYIQSLSIAPVLRNIHAILDLYSSFEFAWVVHNNLSKRTYFYAKPCMLKVCCQMLEIECTLPSLKDKTRERDQFQELKELRSTQAWFTSRESRSNDLRG
jgi:hypothetical protein